MLSHRNEADSNQRASRSERQLAGAGGSHPWTGQPERAQGQVSSSLLKHMSHPRFCTKTRSWLTAQPEHTHAIPDPRGNPEPQAYTPKFQRHRQEDHCVLPTYLVGLCLPVTLKQDSRAPFCPK